MLKYGVLVGTLPGPSEIRVRLRASGVDSSDVEARAGSKGAIFDPQVIPHSDGAGEIDAVGNGANFGRIGERVWLWNAAWQRPDGTCAENVCLPSEQAVRQPDGTDWDAGACLGIPASTACHAVFSDGEVNGQNVLVTGGAGAVGHPAIQSARWGGARVIVTVSGDEKAAAAERARADAVINYRAGDVAEAILADNGGNKVNRIVEVEFGGSLAISNPVIVLGGVIAAYGSAADMTPQLPFRPMMFNHTTVRMMLIYALSAQECARVIDRLTLALESDVLSHAIAAKFDLTDTTEVHLAVESGQLIGNAVIAID